MKKTLIIKFGFFIFFSLIWSYFSLTYFAPAIAANIEIYFIQNKSHTNNTYLSALNQKDNTNNKTSYSEILGVNSVSMKSADIQMSVTDPRVLALRKFLMNYNSPIYPYADVFVYEADQSGLDWRLVASISGVESGFGKMNISQNNAWGWKGGPNNSWSQFPTYREGIQTVSTGLGYWYKGLTPYQIERRYCPDCYEGNMHAWANGVQGYMNELDYYLNNLESL